MEEKENLVISVYFLQLNFQNQFQNKKKKKRGGLRCTVMRSTAAIGIYKNLSCDLKSRNERVSRQLLHQWAPKSASFPQS